MFISREGFVVLQILEPDDFRIRKPTSTREAKRVQLST
jgi:hypothetical protein